MEGRSHFWQWHHWGDFPSERALLLCFSRVSREKEVSKDCLDTSFLSFGGVLDASILISSKLRSKCGNLQLSFWRHWSTAIRLVHDGWKCNTYGGLWRWQNKFRSNQDRPDKAVSGLLWYIWGAITPSLTGLSVYHYLLSPMRLKLWFIRLKLWVSVDPGNLRVSVQQLDVAC